MNLCLYSGGDESENRALDLKVLSLVNSEEISITYIPSCSYDSEVYFCEFVNQYKSLGVKRFIHFAVDVDYSHVLEEEAFKSDIIHLSGGNTYYFLRHLREKNLLPKLKKFVKEGGMLTGLSAGSIIMTPNIETAGFPEFDKDDNEDGMTNFKSLGLVNFEFFPHYKNSNRYDIELKKHSRKIKYPLIACSDGSGIVVSGNKIEFHGKCYRFFNGRKEKIV